MRKNKTTDMNPKTDTGITRWGPSMDLFAWTREMDRWFDDVRRGFEQSWGPAPFASGLAEIREPAVDLRDTGAEFVVTAELPGVSKDDVEIEATPEGLEIRARTQGDREEKDADYCYRERNYRSFFRGLQLPAPIAPDKVAAMLENGVLEVKVPVPKLEKPKGRRLEIS